MGHQLIGRDTMRTLYRIHLLSLLVYIVGIGGGICIFILANRLLEIQLPAWILACITLLCLVLSASLRILVWRKRMKILTEGERNLFGTKIFFLLAWFELFVFIVGLGIIAL